MIPGQSLMSMNAFFLRLSAYLSISCRAYNKKVNSTIDNHDSASLLNLVGLHTLIISAKITKF